MFQKLTFNNQNSLKFLLDKLLSLRRIEYLTLDRELKIRETSLKVQQFADFPGEVVPGNDVRAGFLELIGLEEILIEIIKQPQKHFELQGIARNFKNSSYLYLDLYIFGYQERDKDEKLIIFYEDVTDNMTAKQALVQVAHETSLLLSALATAHDYINKIFNSIADVLLVTTATGKIKIVNQAAQLLFGYSEAELIGQHITLITAEEKLLRQASQVLSSVDSNAANQVTVVCQTKTNLKLSVAFSCSLSQTDINGQRGSADSTQYFVYIGRDITDRERIKKRQAAHYAVTQILSESTSLDDATPKILQAICENLGWDIGELWTPADGKISSQASDRIQTGHELIFSCLRPHSPLDATPCLQRVGVWWQRSLPVSNFMENYEAITLDPGKGLPGIVWVSGCTQWITDVVKDPNFQRSELAAQVGLRSAFAFPIHTNGEVLAVMIFFTVEEQPPDRELLEMMTATGCQLGQFFKRKQAEEELRAAEASIRILYEQEKQQSEELNLKNFALEKTKQELEAANRELQRIASIDGLTQLANRRCFDETLEREWRRMARERSPLSLILCDIDFFKFYNDSYGHQGGDECLKEVAKIFYQNSQRAGDLAARYGGEELALILPLTDAKEAVKVAEIIRSDLQARAILHAASKVSKYVTLSMGIATVVPTHESSFEALITAADRALYRAKAGGRDRVATSF